MTASFTLLDLLRSQTVVDCDTLDSEGSSTPDGYSRVLMLTIDHKVPRVFEKLADCTSNQVRSSLRLSMRGIR